MGMFFPYRKTLVSHSTFYYDLAQTSHTLMHGFFQF